MRCYPKLSLVETAWLMGAVPSGLTDCFDMSQHQHSRCVPVQDIHSLVEFIADELTHGEKRGEPEELQVF